MDLSARWIACMLGSPYEILSLHCSLLNLQRSLGALKPYTATESYLLCVSGVSCHGEKIPFEVWPPSFTLTIMLLALSCPPCKSPCLLFCPAPSPPLLHTPWLFSFVSLSVTFFTRSVWGEVVQNVSPQGMLGSVVTAQSLSSVSLDCKLIAAVKHFKVWLKLENYR